MLGWSSSPRGFLGVWAEFFSLSEGGKWGLRSWRCSVPVRAPHTSLRLRKGRKEFFPGIFVSFHGISTSPGAAGALPMGLILISQKSLGFPRCQLEFQRDFSRDAGECPAAHPCCCQAPWDVPGRAGMWEWRGWKPCQGSAPRSAPAATIPHSGIFRAGHARGKIFLLGYFPLVESQKPSRG